MFYFLIFFFNIRRLILYDFKKMKFFEEEKNDENLAYLCVYSGQFSSNKQFYILYFKYVIIKNIN